MVRLRAFLSKSGPWTKRRGRSGGLWVAVAVSLLVAIVPSTVRAQEDPELSQVVLHTDYVSDGGAEAMRTGVEELWRLIGPLARRHGLHAFPPSDFWGYTTREEAKAQTGRGSFWDNFGGYSEPGVAHAVVPNERSIYVVSHEATHLIQLALNRGNKHQCLLEGAARWYELRVATPFETEAPFDSFEERLEMLRPDAPDAFFKEIAERARDELGLEFERAETWYDDYPSIDSLTTRAAFERAQLSGLDVYNYCMFAFDVLIDSGGGEDAYFSYLADAGQVGWRQAFEANFTDDYPTFLIRYGTYLDALMTDYRLPHEIAHAELLEHIYSNCDPMREVCVT